MRRTELIEAVDQIRKALNEENAKTLNQIISLLRHGARGGSTSPEIQSEILKIFKSYTEASVAFSPLTKKVMEILGIHGLEENRFWVTLIKGDIEDDEFDWVWRLERILGALPQILILLKPEIFTNPTIQKEIDAEREAVMSVILPEDDHFSSPIRISNALLAIELLYEACAELGGISKRHDLAVVSCDSGSDKSFDVLGAAKAIAALKELLLSLWDRMVYYREKKFEQWLQLVADSLPVLEKIGELEGNNSIGREQAEIIRRKVIDGATKFLSSGATIPEMGEVSRLEPRSLLQAEPQLLIGGPSNTEEGGDSSSLTDEEFQMLENLKRKAGEAPDEADIKKKEQIDEDGKGSDEDKEKRADRRRWERE